MTSGMSLDDLASNEHFGGGKGRRETITWLPDQVMVASVSLKPKLTVSVPPSASMRSLPGAAVKPASPDVPVTRSVRLSVKVRLAAGPTLPAPSRSAIDTVCTPSAEPSPGRLGGVSEKAPASRR